MPDTRDIVQAETFWLSDAHREANRGRIDACLYGDGLALVYDADADEFTEVPEGFIAARCKARAMAIVRGDEA